MKRSRIELLAAAAALLWLAANLVLLADGGRGRIALDREIGRLPDAASRRERIFGPAVGPRLAALERELEVLATETHARVAVFAPAPRNVYESLAWHRLFPAAVVSLREDGPDLAERARAAGASALVVHGREGWRVVRLPRTHAPGHEDAR